MENELLPQVKNSYRSRFFLVLIITTLSLSSVFSLKTVLASTANDDSYSIDEDGVLIEPAPGILGNDTGGSLTAVLEDPPITGTLALITTTGAFTYTPPLDYSGLVTFTYHADDGIPSNTAVVTITITAVNDPPIAVNDSYTTTEDVILTVPTPGVLGNDTDVDGGSLTAINTGIAIDGDLAFSSNGSFIYTPTLDYNGLVTFTYYANDTISNSLTSAVVTITITAVNDDPVLATNTGLTLTEGAAMTITNPLLQVADVDNSAAEITYTLQTVPNNGLLQRNDATLAQSDTFTQDDIDQDWLTYIHDDGGTISDTFDFTVSDGVTGSISTTSFNITVIAVNDPPIINDDANTTPEDTAVTTDVLFNDTDVDGNLDPASVSVDSGPSNGSASVNLTNGFITYTPTLNFNGNDSFVYEACDDGIPLPVHCATATVALTITAVNDPPTANDDIGSTDEDTTINISAASGVLNNDTDPDTAYEGDTQTVIDSDTISANGASVSVSSDGSYSYDPTGSSALNALAVTESIIDTFTYIMSDSAGITDTATVNMTVNGRNDSPTANADTGKTDENTTLTVSAPGLLNNDTDPDTTDNLTVSLFDNPSANGAVVNVSSDGSYSYNPANAAALQALDDGDIFVDTFSYTAIDSNGGDSSALVNVTITGTNDAPVLDNTANMTLPNIDEDDTNPNGDLVTTIIANALGDRITDVDDSAIEGIAVVDVNDTNGTWQYSTDNGSNWTDFGTISIINAVLLDASGGTDTRIRFVPNSDYNGSGDNVTFRAWDQTVGSSGDTSVNASSAGEATPYSIDTETATLTVNGVNDAPVLDNSGSMFLPNILEDTVAPNGDTVVSIISSAGDDRITDVDDSSVEGIAVTSVDNSNGLWQYSIDNGNNWSDLIVTETSATLLNPQARIRYVPDGNYFGSSGNVTFRAWDQTAEFNGATGINVSTNGGTTPYSSNTETASLTVVSVNDVPILDLNGPGGNANFFSSFIEDSSPVLIVDTDLTVVDVEGPNLSSATITITNQLDGTSESLSVNTSGTSISAVYDDNTGVLSLVGEDAMGNYQTVLRTLKYHNSSQAPSTTARIIDVVVNDGIDDSNIPNSIVSIHATNDAPVLEVNTGIIVNEGLGGTITEGHLRVSDVDNIIEELLFTVEAVPSHGSLMLNGSTLLLNDTFTQSGITSSLLDYIHDNSETTADSFDFSVSDGKGGNIGTTTFTITISADNDPPILATNLDLLLDEGTSATVTNSLLSVTDTDNTAVQLTYRLEITTGNGHLRLNSIPLSINDTFTQDDLDNDRIDYVHDGSETTSDSFTFAVVDGAGGQINSTVFTITVTPVNDAPIVDLNGTAVGVNHSVTFTEGGGAVSIVTSDMSLIDDDHTSLVSATATLAAYPNGTDESLSVSTGVTSISASYNTATGILTLTGPDTVANFQTVLRTLSYNNTSQDPATAARSVNISASDGVDDSVVTTSSINITALNDVPNLAVNIGLTLDYGKLALITSSELSVTDVDQLPTELIYTLSSVPSHGELKLNSTVLGMNETFTQSDIDNNRISYTHNKTNTESDSFTFSLSDGNGGTIGVTAFAITIRPQPLVFLPVILNNYVFGEPNDSACEAFGINLNQSYQFLPDDDEDWYVFTINSISNLNISITEYVSPDGQLVVYTGTSCSSISQVAGGHNSDISPSGSVTLNSLAAGTYYVRVFTNIIPSNLTAYTLRVSR